MRTHPAVFLLVVLTAGAVGAGGLLASFFSCREQLLAGLEREALTLARTAAMRVEPAAHRRALAHRSVTDPDYASMERALREIRDIWRESGLDVRFVYTLVPDATAPSGLAYAVDAEEKPADKSPIGEPWKPSTPGLQTFDYRRPTAFEYADRYGAFVSGFAPVTDGAADVTAVVGVDLAAAELERAAWRATWGAAVPTAGLAVVALLVAGVFGRRLVRPLERLRTFAARVGDGDLTAQADATAAGEPGEIARMLNATLAGLRVAVRGADSTAARVREACDGLIGRAAKERAAADRAAALGAEAARRAGRIAELASGIAAESAEAGRAAKDTLEIGGRMAEDARAIELGVRGVIDRGQELAACLEVMRTRAATVDAALEAMVQVANRSSVLSLNAEIEANQAGDAGRGFAVVAREIRRLAEQAAANSLEIGSNVAGLHEALAKGAHATESFAAAATTASEQSARLIASLAEARRRLESLAPRLREVDERGEHFQSEGRAMGAGLAEAEEAVHGLHAALASIEETLVDLRDRSAEVQRHLAHLRTE